MSQFDFPLIDPYLKRANDPDTVYMAYIDVSASDMATIGSVPVVLVPAVTGMTIIPDEVLMYTTFGTVAYNLGASVGIYYTDSNGQILIDGEFDSSIFNISSGVQGAIISGTNADDAAIIFMPNTPVVMSTDDASDPTLGDGTMTVRVKYRLF